MKLLIIKNYKNKFTIASIRKIKWELKILQTHFNNFSVVNQFCDDFNLKFDRKLKCSNQLHVKVVFLKPVKCARNFSQKPTSCLVNNYQYGTTPLKICDQVVAIHCKHLQKCIWNFTENNKSSENARNKSNRFTSSL